MAFWILAADSTRDSILCARRGGGVYYLRMTSDGEESSFVVDELLGQKDASSSASIASAGAISPKTSSVHEVAVATEDKSVHRWRISDQDGIHVATKR